MPIRIFANQRAPQPPRAQEAPRVRAGQPNMGEPADAPGMEHERPYQAFVEREARQYWQEMSNVGSLTKPAEQEIRAAAMPILVQGLRSRCGFKSNPAMNRAQMAVDAMQLHLVESGRLQHPFTLSEPSPNYIEALIQLADDADWLAGEIQLPDHPSIFYSRDTRTGKLVPKKDSYIRGKYLSEVFGSRLSNDTRIYPNTSPNRGSVYYTLDDRSGTPSVRIYYHEDRGRGWRDFSGVIFHDKALEALRSANIRIISLKGSGLSRQETDRGIYEIRKSFGLH